MPLMITGHSLLEFPEMVGHHTVFQDSMHYEYGPLAQAMRHGGLFLLNEIDLLDPSTAAGLNSVLDGYPLTIPENNGELIMPHPMFKFAATANTNGGSDPSGLYQGVLRQNIAFMDRFVLVEAGYMAESQELGILKNYVGGRIAEETLPRMHRSGGRGHLLLRDPCGDLCLCADGALAGGDGDLRHHQRRPLLRRRLRH